MNADGTIDVAEVRDAYVAAGYWGTEPLSAVVARHAAERPDDDAYRWGETSLTWSAYDSLATDIAKRLAGLDVAPDDRVLVQLPDGGAVHAAYVGCERAALSVVGVGWRAGERELASLVAKTKPVAAVLPEQTQLGSAAEVADRLGVEKVLIIEDLDGSPRPATGPVGEPAGARPPSTISMFNSTSGTTGLPKCVTQTQSRWGYFHQLAVEFGELRDDEVWMSVVPAPFGFGLWTSHFSPTLIGAPCVVQPRFDARAAAAAIEANGVTVLCAVSSQFVMILEHAHDFDLTSLRVMFTGGERLPLAKARQFEAQTGCAVLNFYGSNESGVLSGTRVTDSLEKRVATGGRVVPEMEVRLYDGDLNRLDGDVGTGRPACRGPATSPGYLDDPEANAELFTPDGWMLMGDIVTIDTDGWLTVVGRSADFIVRGGKNISAPAVGGEVLTHPSVAFAAAVAVPDERLGERVGICVQLKDGCDLDFDGLKAHLDARGVSKEWWPERLALVDELPVSSGGKIAKGQLKERVGELFG